MDESATFKLSDHISVSAYRPNADYWVVCFIGAEKNSPVYAMTLDGAALDGLVDFLKTIRR